MSFTLAQAEVLLQEATMEYLRSGTNKAEVEHYAYLVAELSHNGNQEFLTES